MKLDSQALSLIGEIGEHWFGSLSTPSYPLVKAMALGLYCHDCLWLFSCEKARLSLGLVCLVSFPASTYYVIGPIPQLECHHLSICHHSQLSNSCQSFLTAWLHMASSWVLVTGLRRDGMQRNTLDPWQNRVWHALGT